MSARFYQYAASWFPLIFAGKSPIVENSCQKSQCRTGGLGGVFSAAGFCTWGAGLGCNGTEKMEQHPEKLHIKTWKVEKSSKTSFVTPKPYLQIQKFRDSKVLLPSFLQQSSGPGSPELSVLASENMTTGWAPDFPISKLRPLASDVKSVSP